MWLFIISLVVLSSLSSLFYSSCMSQITNQRSNVDQKTPETTSASPTADLLPTPHVIRRSQPPQLLLGFAPDGLPVTCNSNIPSPLWPLKTGIQQYTHSPMMMPPFLPQNTISRPGQIFVPGPSHDANFSSVLAPPAVPITSPLDSNGKNVSRPSDSPIAPSSTAPQNPPKSPHLTAPELKLELDSDDVENLREDSVSKPVGGADAMDKTDDANMADSPSMSNEFRGAPAIRGGRGRRGGRGGRGRGRRGRRGFPNFHTNKNSEACGTFFAKGAHCRWGPRCHRSHDGLSFTLEEKEAAISCLPPHVQRKHFSILAKMEQNQGNNGRDQNLSDESRGRGFPGRRASRGRNEFQENEIRGRRRARQMFQSDAVRDNYHQRSCGSRDPRELELGAVEAIGRLGRDVLFSNIDKDEKSKMLNKMTNTLHMAVKQGAPKWQKDLS